MQMTGEPDQGAPCSNSTTFQDLPNDVLTTFLRRLDGRSLAAASCANSNLHSLATDQDTWRSICLSTWPSLSALLLLPSLPPPRRLFADAFPFPSHITHTTTAAAAATTQLPCNLISAVDLYHNGVPFFSRVVETSTSSRWFLGTPFRIDAIDRKDQSPPPQPAQVVSPSELTLSWIVIDADRMRALNISSRAPVELDRHWYTGEILVRFATVVGEHKLEAVVTCSEESGHVREVSLGVEDKDGMALNGEGSLGVLVRAMEGRREGQAVAGMEMEEVMKRRYEEFVRTKRGRKESKARREVMVDLCCSTIGAALVLVFLLVVLLR